MFTSFLRRTKYKKKVKPEFDLLLARTGQSNIDAVLLTEVEQVEVADLIDTST